MTIGVEWLFIAFMAGVLVGMVIVAAMVIIKMAQYNERHP